MSEPECPHCHRPIPKHVFELHTAHCARFLYTCKGCGELLPRVRQKQHDEEAHAEEVCPYCGESLQLSEIERHKSRCELRPRACRFCTSIFPFEEVIEHEEACGTRTECCSICSQYVLKKDFPYHVVTCTGSCGNGDLKRKRTDTSEPRGKRGKRGT